jgi:GTPase
MSEEGVLEIGTVKHFFHKISVALVDLTAPLSVGDCILFKGSTTNFQTTVNSIQVENTTIQRAEAGQSVGLKISQVVKQQDVVYKKL